MSVGTALESTSAVFSLKLHTPCCPNSSSVPPFTAPKHPAFSPCSCWPGCAPPVPAHGPCVALLAAALCPLSEHNRGTSQRINQHRLRCLEDNPLSRYRKVPNNSFPNGCWPQLGPSLSLRGSQPHVELLNKRWLLWVCPPRCSQCCAQGFMHCSVPQLEGVMSWLCWPQDLHIYMEVSLYREAVGWVTSMQAAVAGPPRACRTAAPSEGHSPAVGLLVFVWCARCCWHSHPCCGLSSRV